MNAREPLFLTYRSALHGGVMSDTVIEAKPANPKADEWADRIAVQRRNGISVKQFCKEQGLTDYSSTLRADGSWKEGRCGSP